MKRFLSLFIVFIFSLSMFSQKIIKDVDDENGRYVQTSYNFYTKNKMRASTMPGSVSLGAIISQNNDTSYIMTLAYSTTAYNNSFTISKDSKIMFKLDNGENVVGKLCSEIDVLAQHISYTYGIKTIDIFPQYCITSADMKKLVSHTCTKYRIECNWGKNGYVDIMVGPYIKKFDITTPLSNQYNVLTEYLNKKESNTFFENF